MTLQNYHIERGKLGNTPAMATRADEAYLDYVSETRNVLMHAQMKNIADLAAEKLEAANIRPEHSKEGVQRVMSIARNVPELATFLRVKRSLQEAYWQRIMDSYRLDEQGWADKLDAADKQGPGSVTYDPDFKYPEYAKVDIHIQPGGYVRNPLTGPIYDYGLKIFFGGAGDEDSLHDAMAMKTALPEDGQVSRVMEIGCSIGQLACSFKKRFGEDTEVWGTDISSQMVRYAHLRAMEQNLDVHFAQMAAEDMSFPDNHFDLVSAHLLFHEIPLPVIERTLAEVKRVLRPGGTFVIWDFQTASKNRPGYGGFTGLMDAADNGEPYAYDFVRCDIEKKIEDTGYILRETDLDDINKHGRICDKPA